MTTVLYTLYIQEHCCSTRIHINILRCGIISGKCIEPNTVYINVGRKSYIEWIVILLCIDYMCVIACVCFDSSEATNAVQYIHSLNKRTITIIILCARPLLRPNCYILFAFPDKWHRDIINNHGIVVSFTINASELTAALYISSAKVSQPHNTHTHMDT